ncbi:MAG TPA: nucleoside-diphosphate kinase [Nitrolancea sp.]|nr:nucleoside-diphosphate kinase [Nitrolancea sp.]
MERTLIIIKPDGVQRGLIGPVIERFERRGLKVVGLKMIQISRELAERHYGIHREKPFFGGLVDFITSSPVVVGVLEGPNAIEVVRNTVGATNPGSATPGSIRADFGLTIGRNLVHASDGADTAQSEVELFFSSDELMSYDRSIERWLIED